MKQGLHPEYTTTTVTCNGCGTKFETRSTTDSIEVEICSECHPFYTGKQKLVDVAGRVDRFKARQAAAGDKDAAEKKQSQDKGTAGKSDKKDLQSLKDLKKDAKGK